MHYFGPDDSMHSERIGNVVRHEMRSEGRWGVTVRILMHFNAGIYSGLEQRIFIHLELSWPAWLFCQASPERKPINLGGAEANS